MVNFTVAGSALSFLKITRVSKLQSLPRLPQAGSKQRQVRLSRFSFMVIGCTERGIVTRNHRTNITGLVWPWVCSDANLTMGKGALQGIAFYNKIVIFQNLKRARYNGDK